MALELKIKDGYVDLKLDGRLTAAEIRQVIAFLNQVESTAAASPHRLIDITEVFDLQLDFTVLHDLASQRRAVKLKNPVRSAVVARTSEQYGMARMFEMLNQQLDTEIAVFENSVSALRWLFATAPRAKASA